MPRIKSKTIRRILVTAGPTREMIDPVRFITNLSTGEMGYAVAREARRKGYEVTLISGPTALTPPRGVRFVPIVTVDELTRALDRYFSRTDVLVMSAAVGDFAPLRRATRKIPRQRILTLRFRETPDLIRRMAGRKGRRVVIGFSLETDSWLARSRSKREAKKLDGMVANYFSNRQNPFGRTGVHVALIDARKIRVLRFTSKSKLARRLLDWILELAQRRSKN